MVFSASGSRNHHHTHPILSHDWSLLQGSKNHYHTLKAGRHTFPFSYTFEGNLPSTLRTYLNDAAIGYKLRATAVRSTFSTNFHASKNVTLVRGYTHEALEYTQTLEIENTWPGKVMYCLTLPHKAYAAGDEIPISMKFMPLAKGTRVTHVSSIIKEYTMVHTRHSSHPESRIAASAKHEIRDGKAYRVNERGPESAAPAHHFHGEEGTIPGLVSAPPSAPPSPSHRALRDHGLGHITPLLESSVSRVASSASFLNAQSLQTPHAPTGSEQPSYFGSGNGSNAVAGPSSGTVAEVPDDLRERDPEEIVLGDEEIDTMITVPVPSWTTPGHSVYPVFVTHKIKWSCAITNPDGHISELRCALPILILPHSLLEEAQAATSGTRAILFGGVDEAPTIDLPSYNDHVYDRIAGMAPGPTSSYITSGHRTPNATPPASRGPSRPGSPTRNRSTPLASGTQSRRSSNGAATPIDSADIADEPLNSADELPARPQLSNWADSELLLSLGALAGVNNSPSAVSSPHRTPPESRVPSRPGSRMGLRSGRTSNQGSRPGSRAASPERANHSHNLNSASGGPPPMDRRPSHGVPSLFHLPSSIKPFTSVRQNSRIGGLTAATASADQSPRQSPQLRAHSHLGSSSLPRATFSLGSHAAFTALEQQSVQQHQQRQSQTEQSEAHLAALNVPNAAAAAAVGIEPSPLPVDRLSQVPSYAIASQGFLGGGVVPISTGPPTYADSERFLDRTRSEGALADLGRQAEEESLAQMVSRARLGDADGDAEERMGSAEI